MNTEENKPAETIEEMDHPCVRCELQEIKREIREVDSRLLICITLMLIGSFGSTIATILLLLRH